MKILSRVIAGMKQKEVLLFYSTKNQTNLGAFDNFITSPLDDMWECNVCKCVITRRDTERYQTYLEEYNP